MRRGRAGRYAWIVLAACEPPSVVVEDAAVDGGADAGRVEVCARASDCVSTFCNPARCAPGEPGASADGCLAEPGPCAAGEVCDEAPSWCLAADCESSGDADGELGDRVGDHMMGGCSDRMAGPTYECSLVPVRVARPM